MKRKRTHLDDRIAQAKSQEEKRWLAAFDRPSPLAGIPRFVRLWRTVRAGRAEKQDMTELVEALEIETRNRFVRAMVHCQPETLEEIAREMRRQEKEGKVRPPDEVRYAMLVEEEKPKPDWRGLAKLYVSKFGGVDDYLRSMRRIRERWKRKRKDR